MNEFLHRLPLFIHHHLMLVLLFVVLLLAVITSYVNLLLRKYRELTPASLTLLINRESPLLIDLSAYDDFEKMHVPGARHMPMSQFDPEQKTFATDKDRPIVLMDKDGRSNSVKAATLLTKAGFTKVYVLGGGVLSWHGAQLPLGRGAK